MQHNDHIANYFVGNTVIGGKWDGAEVVIPHPDVESMLWHAITSFIQYASTRQGNCTKKILLVLGIQAMFEYDAGQNI